MELLESNGTKIKSFVVTQKTNENQIDIIELKIFKAKLDKKPRVVIDIGPDL